MENRCIQIEFELATLLGWESLHIGPESLISAHRATYGVPNSKDEPYRCRMPMWVRDWHDCGKLMVQHKVYIHAYHRHSVDIRFVSESGDARSLFVPIADYGGLDMAVRVGIVSAVIMKLQEEKALKHSTPQVSLHNDAAIA